MDRYPRQPGIREATIIWLPMAVNGLTAAQDYAILQRMGWRRTHHLSSTRSPPFNSTLASGGDLPASARASVPLPAALDAQHQISQVPSLIIDIIDLLAEGVLEFLALCIRETIQPSTLCSCGGAPERGGTSFFALIMPPWLSGGMCFFASECPRTWQRRHTASTATSSGRSSCSTALQQLLRNQSS